jgi:hypothetical protein
MTEEQLERYRKWQATDPKTIERLPEPYRSEVKSCIKAFEELMAIESQELAVAHSTAVEHQQKLARREYIKYRSSIIAPPPSQSESSFIEKPIQILIVVVSAVMLGTGTANLARDSGKEDWALVAGSFGGALIGILAEITGKKVFVDRYMSDRYRAERKRLTAKQEIIQSRIQEISSQKIS